MLIFLFCEYWTLFKYILWSICVLILMVCMHLRLFWPQFHRLLQQMQRLTIVRVRVHQLLRNEVNANILKPTPEGFNVRNSTERGKRVRNEGYLYLCSSPFGLYKQDQKKEGQKAKTSNGDNQDVLLDKKIPNWNCCGLELGMISKHLHLRVAGCKWHISENPFASSKIINIQWIFFIYLFMNTTLMWIK